MEVEHSLEKIQPKLIDLLLTFVDRWPSQWLRVACASVLLCSCLMQSALPNPCRSSLRLMAQSRGNSHQMTLPMSLRSLSIAGLELLLFLWRFVSRSIKRLQPIVILDANPTPRRAGSILNGECEGFVQVQGYGFHASL